MNAFVQSTGAILIRGSCNLSNSASLSSYRRVVRATPVIYRNFALRRKQVVSSRPLRAVFGFGAASMRIAKDGDRVKIEYTGRLEDGSEFDSSRKRGAPLVFQVGSGQVIPGFDEAVRGLSEGQSTQATIPPEKAYGEYTERLIMTVPRERAPSDMKLEKGQKVALNNGATATVLEVDDQNIEFDANHELAGKTLTFDLTLVGFQDNVLGRPAEGLERLICAAGCFWGIELAFQREPGVVSTHVGYTQGQQDNPTYRAVCSGKTGHTEALAVDYDPKRTSYVELLDLFWRRLGKSALTLNRAGNDVGTQYRSGIYYLSEEQRALAEETAEKVSKDLGKQVVTEIKSGAHEPFYIAEEYHQKYLEKGGQSAAKGDTTPIRCYG